MKKLRLLPSRRRTVQRVGEHPNPAMQFLIYVAKLPVTLQLIRRKTKPCQHDDENQTIPELQTPLDGIEYFHSMQ